MPPRTALFPTGYDHERMSYEIINCDEMARSGESMRPSPEPDDVAKLALGPKQVEKLRLPLAFTHVGGDPGRDDQSATFGADRIDYLLRDSLHTGVAYGRFDHHRLIQTLRIMPAPATPQEETEETGDQPEVGLGIERGGLESAEALMLARYLMFSQVYYHPTRLIYDAHLKDFLAAWLPGGQFSPSVEDLLALTDNEVMVAMLAAVRDDGAAGHDPARRILERDHFRVAYQRKADDIGQRAIATRAIFNATVERFSDENVRYGASRKRPDPPDFPVRERDGTSSSSLALSEVLVKLPGSRDEYVFVAPELRRKAVRWIEENREEIIANAITQQDEEAAA